MSMAQVLKLKPAFSDEQAQALVGLFDEEAATKADLEKVRLQLAADLKAGDDSIRADLERTKYELKAEIEKLRLEVQRDLKGTEARLAT